MRIGNYYPMSFSLAFPAKVHSMADGHTGVEAIATSRYRLLPLIGFLFSDIGHRNTEVGSLN